MSIIRKAIILDDSVMLSPRSTYGKHAADDYVEASVENPSSVTHKDIIENNIYSPIETDYSDIALTAGYALHREQPILTYEEYKQRFENELDDIRQETISTATKEGYELGKAEAEAEHNQKLDAFSSLIEEITTKLIATFEDTESYAIEIAFEALCKILGETLATEKGVATVVNQVLNRVKSQHKLQIRVSPHEYQILSRARHLLHPTSSNQFIELVSDERVELGGCFLESNTGNLDGRLETQLQILRETLMHVYQKRNDQGAGT